VRALILVTLLESPDAATTSGRVIPRHPIAFHDLSVWVR
jgi:hypothetical protein